MEYQITWEIDIEAETPEEAAQLALGMQRDHNSSATIFDVYDPATGVSYDIAVTDP